MAGASIAISNRIDDRQIIRVLQGLERKELAPALKNIGEYLVRSTEGRFSAQKDPDGNVWAPLSPKYKEKKKGSKILTESSRLRDSIVWQVRGSSLKVGTNLEYAALHQFGFAGKMKVPSHKRMVKKVFGKDLAFPVWAEVRAHERSANVPARPFLGLSMEDRQEVLDIARDFYFKK